MSGTGKSGASTNHLSTLSTLFTFENANFQSNPTCGCTKNVDLQMDVNKKLNNEIYKTCVNFVMHSSCLTLCAGSQEGLFY